MSTGSKRTYFEDLRNLPQQRVKDTFFDYLETRVAEIAARVWGGERGVFGTATLVAAGADAFSVTTLPLDLLDGNGQILTLTSATAANVKFENAAATQYYVAARHVKVPSGVLRNPRNDVIFYDVEVDAVGERADATSVAEVAGTLEICVDSVFEAGVSHAGRLVTVFLKRPRTTVESDAIERNLTVQWTGAVNRVVTSGLLGQGAGAASILAADYEVVAQGVTVRKSDLSTVFPYAYLGRVTGGGAGNPPSAFSTVGQVDVSDGINPDLQEAYTAGRIITPAAAHGGAVKISSADAGDMWAALLHLDRRLATEDEPVGLLSVGSEEQGSALLALAPLYDPSGGTLNLDEAGTTAAGGLINLTRGTVNLTAPAAGVNRNYDFVHLSGFATVDGTYLLQSVAGNQVSLVDLNCNAPATWPVGESGNVSFYRARFRVGDGRFGKRNGFLDRTGLSAEVALIGGNGPGGAPAATVLRVSRGGAEDLVQFMAQDANPEKRTFVDRNGILNAEIGGLNSTPDKFNALMRLSRYGNSAKMAAELHLEAAYGNACPLAVTQVNFYGTDLLESEAATFSGAVATLTRGAVNLLSYGVALDLSYNLAEVFDAVDKADNGIYRITAVTSSTLTLQKQSGAAVSFSGASGNVRILFPLFLSAGSAPWNGVGMWRGALISGRDNVGGNSGLTLHPRGLNGTLLRALNNRMDSVNSVAQPQELLRLDTEGTAAGSPGGTLRLGNWVGTIGAESGVHAPLGVDFVGHVGGTNGADKHAFNVDAATRDPLYAQLVSRLFAFKLKNGEEAARFTPIGWMAHGTKFEDDFFYRTQAALTGIWAESFVGSGTNYYNDNVNYPGRHGGFVLLKTAAAASGNLNNLVGPGFIMRNAGEARQMRQLIYVVRVAISANAGAESALLNAEYHAELFGSNVAHVGLRYVAGGSAGNWEVVCHQGGAYYTVTIPGTPVIASAVQDDGWVTAAFWLDLTGNQILYAVKGSGGVGGTGGTQGSFQFQGQASTDWDGPLKPRFLVQQGSAEEKRFYVDYCLIQEGGLKGYLDNEIPKE